MKTFRTLAALACGVLAVGIVLATPPETPPSPGTPPLLPVPAADADPRAARDAKKANATLPTETEKPASDTMLVQARHGAGMLMIVDHAVSQVEEAGGDLVITTALDEHGKPQTVRLRSGKSYVFRTDAGHDDFTKSGGWYWQSGDQESRTRFEKHGSGSWNNAVKGEHRPGPLVMVVYQNDGTIHWYALGFDFRC